MLNSNFTCSDRQSWTRLFLTAPSLLILAHLPPGWWLCGGFGCSCSGSSSFSLWRGSLRRAHPQWALGDSGAQGLRPGSHGPRLRCSYAGAAGCGPSSHRHPCSRRDSEPARNQKRRITEGKLRGDRGHSSWYRSFCHLWWRSSGNRGSGGGDDGKRDRWGNTQKRGRGMEPARAQPTVSGLVSLVQTYTNPHHVCSLRS